MTNLQGDMNIDSYRRHIATQICPKSNETLISKNIHIQEKEPIAVVSDINIRQ